MNIYSDCDSGKNYCNIRSNCLKRRFQSIDGDGIPYGIGDFSLNRGSIRTIEAPIAANLQLQGDKLMKIRAFCPILFLLICLMVPLTATAQAVAIPDANLRAGIETALSKAPGDPISQGDMATLTELNASESGISDLTGLEYATNLSTLNLYNNSASGYLGVGGIDQLDRAESSRQLSIGYLGVGRFGQFDRTESLQQLGIGYLGVGRLNQLDISGSWRQLGIGYLGVGRFGQFDRVGSLQQP